MAKPISSHKEQTESVRGQWPKVDTYLMSSQRMPFVLEDVKLWRLSSYTATGIYNNFLPDDFMTFPKPEIKFCSTIDHREVKR